MLSASAAHAIRIVMASFLFVGAAHPVRAQTKPSTSPSPSIPKLLTLNLGEDISIKLVEIPPGQFKMGSPETEKDRDASEVQHTVTLTKPFYMATTPITVAQFFAFVKQTGYKTSGERNPPGNFDLVLEKGNFVFQKVLDRSWRNPGYPQKPDHPVVCISWYDCHAFCEWLSAKAGRSVRLPSEAQFEYTARAGSTTTYPWGDDPDGGKSMANLADQAQKKLLPNASPLVKYYDWDDGFAYASPVASFKPNAFGLYDMTGNVWQWCEDKCADYSPEPATDPLITGIRGTRWVARGGSFASSPAKSRAAARFSLNPGNHRFYNGFRVIVADEKN